MSDILHIIVFSRKTAYATCCRVTLIKTVLRHIHLRWLRGISCLCRERQIQPANPAAAGINRVIPGMLSCILLAELDRTTVIPAVTAIAVDLGGYEPLSWIVVL